MHGMCIHLFDFIFIHLYVIVCLDYFLDKFRIIRDVKCNPYIKWIRNEEKEREKKNQHNKMLKSVCRIE